MAKLYRKGIRAVVRDGLSMERSVLLFWMEVEQRRRP